MVGTHLWSHRSPHETQPHACRSWRWDDQRERRQRLRPEGCGKPASTSAAKRRILARAGVPKNREVGAAVWRGRYWPEFRRPHRTGIDSAYTARNVRGGRCSERPLDPAGKRKAVPVNDRGGDPAACHGDVVRQARVAERPVARRQPASTGQRGDVRRVVDDLAVGVVLLNDQDHVPDVRSGFPKSAAWN